MAKKLILIVEDDRDIAEILATDLTAQGYDILLAFDGNQGIMFAMQRVPDLVILDCMMPAGGGFFVYERLRSSTKTLSIPVIFITAIPEEELRSKIQFGRRSFYCPKPFRPAQLRALLVQVLAAPAAEDQATKPE